MYAMRNQLNEYRQSGVLAEASVASPHRQIQMLFEGTLESLAMARGAMAQDNIPLKSRKIGHAINIIQGLRASLDHERSQELAGNLDALYLYMTQRLVESNLHDDVARLDEVAGLLRVIKSGWDGIPEQMRKAS